jgi:hypothetical protein
LVAAIVFKAPPSVLKTLRKTIKTKTFKTKIKMLPTLEFNEYSEIYTLTLSRKGKEVTHKFNALALSQADSDVPDDEFTYYIYAKYDEQDIMLWIKKEEADLIKKRMNEIREDLANYRQSKREMREYLAELHEESKEACTFCGEEVGICGEDHGDEMREIQRECGRY